MDKPSRFTKLRKELESSIDKFEQQIGVKPREQQIDKKIMLIIGGGEIGTEIALTALKSKTFKWLVRVTVGENEDEPVRNLARYEAIELERKKSKDYFSRRDRDRRIPLEEELIPRKDDFSASIDEPDFNNAFLYIKCPKPYRVESLKTCISTYCPDVVILEDPFLCAEDWMDLYAKIEKEKLGKMPVFIPSPTKSVHTPSGACQSDVFLIKRSMRKFLFEAIDEDKTIRRRPDKFLLGKPDDFVIISELQKELENNKHDAQFQKIESLLCDSKNGLVFKLDQASSGVGQFRLLKTEDLKAEFLTKQLEFQKKECGTENRFLVMEKYLPNSVEACAIITRYGSGRTDLMNRIYYKKYSEEEEKEERLKGSVRLAWSLTENSQRDRKVWRDLNKIVRSVARRLEVPFLYVEFILDLENITKGKPKIYLNEISYRPDDAGFITRISHEKDQFSLFVQSIENIPEIKKPFKSAKGAHLLGPKGSYTCETLIPGEIIHWDEDPHLKANLNYEFPPSETKIKGKRQAKLRLYQKTLVERAGKVDYTKIIGYLCHSSEEDGKDWLIAFQRTRDIKKETVKRLIDSLPINAYGDLKRARALAKNGFSRKEILKAVETTQSTPPKHEVCPGRIQTGFAKLDTLLFGGIPKEYAVVLISPPTDEKERIIRSFLENGAEARETTLYLTTAGSNAKDLSENYRSNFCLLVFNAQAETAFPKQPNIFRLKGVENITEIEIALIKALRTSSTSEYTAKRICLELVSDVLLQHHGVETRRWLSALLPKLKTKGFTVLAVVNPQIHSAEDLKTVTDLFAGEIYIREKETEKGTERFLQIKRMSDQEYVKEEVML